MTRKRNTSRQRAHSAAIYTPAAALMILFIAVFGISVFFRISVIEVIGAARYSPEDIIRASGLEIGENLIFSEHDSAARRIREELPYISQVKITRRLPDVVVIEVTESAAIAVLTGEGSMWLIDDGGRILEKAELRASVPYINVTGITPVEPAAGKPLAVSAESDTRLMYLITLLTAVRETDSTALVSDINMSNISNITFTYDARFNVRFGSGEDAAYKLRKLEQVTQSMNDGETGTAEFTANNEVRIIP
jgi:cell division protein FtsQ